MAFHLLQRASRSAQRDATPCDSRVPTNGDPDESAKPPYPPSSEPKLLDAAELNDTQKAQLARHLAEHGQAPLEFVVSRFEHCDVLLLGEIHQVRQHCEFVQDLIEPLYLEAGVQILFSEFIPRRLNDSLKELVTAEQYDPELARAIFRQNAWPTWGFQEYFDILHSAWKLNHELGEDDPPFLVIGMDNDWSQYDLWFGHATAEDRMMQALEREECMVRVGRDHAFDHGMRLGAQLRAKAPGRVELAALHFRFPTRSGQSSLHQAMEAAFRANGNQAVGFELAGSPFAGLREPGVAYWQAEPDTGLSRWIQHYLFLVPLDQHQGMHWVAGFITEPFFPKALAVAERLGWVPKGQCKSAAELDRMLVERFSD